VSKQGKEGRRKIVRVVWRGRKGNKKGGKKKENKLVNNKGNGRGEINRQ
jgi:hypothetical protein